MVFHGQLTVYKKAKVVDGWREGRPGYSYTVQWNSERNDLPLTVSKRYKEVSLESQKY